MAELGKGRSIMIKQLVIALGLILSIAAPISGMDANVEEEIKNPTILKMDLSWDDKITNIDFLINFPALISLNLFNCGNLKECDSIKYLTNLTELNLYNTKFNKPKLLKYLPNLRSLDISSQDIPKAMKYIVQLTRLKELKLTGYNLMGLKEISKLTSLKSLTLRGVFNNDDHDPDFVYPTLDFISPLINLTRLDISSNDYIYSIMPLVNMPKLKYLDVSACYNIKDLKQIRNLKSLKELTLIPSPDDQLISGLYGRVVKVMYDD